MNHKFMVTSSRTSAKPVSRGCLPLSINALNEACSFKW